MIYEHDFYDDDIFLEDDLVESDEDSEIEESIKIDLQTLLTSLGIEEITIKGDSAHIRCTNPEHEDKHPSAFVRPISNNGLLDYTIKCYSCGHFELLSDMLKKTNLEMPKIENKSPEGFVSMNSFSELEEVLECITNRQEAVEYCLSRGVSLDTMLELGALVPKGDVDNTEYRKIFIPSKIDDLIVGLNYRNYHDDDLLEYEMKSGTVQGTGKSFLIGMEHLDRDRKTVVVEGLFDYLALYELGLMDVGYNVVAMCGASMQKEAFGVFQVFDMVSNMLFFTDNDSAGRGSILQSKAVNEIESSGASVSEYFSGKKRFISSVKEGYKDTHNLKYPSLIDYKKLFLSLEERLDKSDERAIMNLYKCKDPASIVKFIKEQVNKDDLILYFLSNLDTFFVR